MIIVYDLIFPLIHRNYRSRPIALSNGEVVSQDLSGASRGSNTPGTFMLEEGFTEEIADGGLEEVE